MKKFYLFALMMLAAVLTGSSQTSVQFALTDPQFGISKTTNATVVVQSEAIGQNGTVTLLPLQLRQITDTNGQTTFTNLYGSSISGFYHWTVSIYNSSQKVQGDMWVYSTNLGTIKEGVIDIVNGAPTYPAGTWAWSAQASELRYAASTNTLGSYVQIGQLLSTSNSIVAGLPNLTNGFGTIVFSNANAYATLSQITNHAVTITNGFTSIVFSNPASYTTPSQVTNLILVIASTNSGITLAQATNIANGVYSNNPASFVTATITNGLASTNFVASSTNGLVTSSVTNGLSTTNFVVASVLNQGIASTNYATGATNGLQTNIVAWLAGTNTALVALIGTTSNGLTSGNVTTSNALNNAKQPASGILTNLAVTGAFTNSIAPGQNFTLTTNGSGTIVSLNATNQTFLTNGFTGIVFANSNAVVFTNQITGITNGFVSASVTNGLATLGAVTNYAYPIGNPSNFVTASITNTLAGLNYVYPTSNPSAFVSASITNGLATLGAMTNYAYPIGNPSAFVSASITNGLATTNWVNSNPSAFVSASVTNGLATTNWVKAGFDTNGAALAAVTGLSFQAGSVTLSNLSGTGAWTNNIVAGQNVSITTNFSGNTIYVNATNQTFLTNGIPGLVQITNIASAISLAQGIADTNFTLQTGTALTNLVYSVGLNNSNNEATLYNLATNYAFSLSTNPIPGHTSIVYSNPATAYATPSFLTNATLQLISQYASNPTNGVSALTATNIATSVVNQYAWLLAGEQSVTNGQFLGTTNAFTNTINIVSGGSPTSTASNTVNIIANNHTIYSGWSSPGPVGSGDVQTIMGLNNAIAVSGHIAAILNGQSNYVYSPAYGSVDPGGNVIVSGFFNTNGATSYGFIGNGNANVLSSDPFEFIGDGQSNHVASSSWGTILNGKGNLIKTTQDASQIYGNNLIGNGQYNTVGSNTVGSYVNYSTILNGSNNVNGGAYSTILNGINNTITASNSTIIGSYTTVSNEGSMFVSDSRGTTSTATNYSLTLKFLNGVGINTNYTAGNALRVLGNIDINGKYTVNGQNYTNGLATTNYVNAATAGLSTNGLATTNYVIAYADTNGSAFVVSGNGTNAVSSGNGGNGTTNNFGSGGTGKGGFGNGGQGGVVGIAMGGNASNGGVGSGIGGAGGTVNIALAGPDDVGTYTSSNGVVNVGNLVINSNCVAYGNGSGLTNINAGANNLITNNASPIMSGYAPNVPGAIYIWDTNNIGYDQIQPDLNGHLTANSGWSGTFTGNGGGLTNLQMGATVVTVSANGIANGQSTIPNAGANLGPDIAGSTTYGVAEYLSNVVKQASIGATNFNAIKFRFGPGLYTMTGGIQYSNGVTYSLMFEGAGKAATRIFFNNTNRTPAILFQSNPYDGTATTPAAHIEFRDILIAGLNAKRPLLAVTNFSYLDIHDCAFFSWESLTNSQTGANLSVYANGVNQMTNLPCLGLVGLSLSTAGEIETLIRDNQFFGLSDGISLSSDHVIMTGNTFGQIGSTTRFTTNLWAATGNLSLGGAAVMNLNLNGRIADNHLYGCLSGFDFDTGGIGESGVYILNNIIEVCNYPVAIDSDAGIWSFNNGGNIWGINGPNSGFTVQPNYAITSHSFTACLNDSVDLLAGARTFSGTLNVGSITGNGSGLTSLPKQTNSALAKLSLNDAGSLTNLTGNGAGLTNLPSQTNGLGSAAYTASTAYDASGAALNATNNASITRLGSNVVNNLTVTGPGSVVLTTNANGSIVAAVTVNGQTNSALTALSQNNGSGLTNLASGGSNNISGVIFTNSIVVAGSVAIGVIASELQYRNSIISDTGAQANYSTADADSSFKTGGFGNSSERLHLNNALVSVKTNVVLWGQVTATNGYFIPSNSVVASPIAGGGLLWNSNNALYWITSAHTNYVTGP